MKIDPSGVHRDGGDDEDPPGGVVPAPTPAAGAPLPAAFGRQPLPDLSDLEDILPVNVGRLRLYEVGKQIGSGKFSVVFRARMADGRNVALKKIQIFNIMDAKSRNKCLREVR